eukprot:c18105_g2_i1 orf=242-394(-)
MRYTGSGCTHPSIAWVTFIHNMRIGSHSEAPGVGGKPPFRTLSVLDTPQH